MNLVVARGSLSSWMLFRKSKPNSYTGLNFYLLFCYLKTGFGTKLVLLKADEVWLEVEPGEVCKITFTNNWSVRCTNGLRNC